MIGQVKAKEMIMLGRRVNASEAKSWGLLTQIEKADNSELRKMLEHLINLKPGVFAQAKKELQYYNQIAGRSNI